MWEVDRSNLIRSSLELLVILNCQDPDKTKFFDTYETVNLLKKEERKFYVTYRAISLQIFENSNEEQYDRISIREHVLDNSRENIVSKSMMKKKISSSIEIFQLSTFDDTSSFESTSINIFVAVEISKSLFRKKTSDKEMIKLSRKNQSLNKENNISSRKESFLCSHSSNLSNDLFETENAFLNVLISKNINSRIDEINIVKKKRVRRFSKDFANTTWTSEKIQKIFVFHTTMMIVFNTKTSKFEIKTTSSFKFHINNLSKSFLHWRIMLRHLHAKKILKIAQIKYDVIETKKIWKIVDKKTIINWYHWNEYSFINLISTTFSSNIKLALWFVMICKK